MIRAAVLGCVLALPGDAWFAPDKVKHFFVSAFVQSLAYGALRGAGVRHDMALGGATLSTGAIGIGKEIHDCRVKGEFGARDLTWDAIGAGAATLMLVRTRQ